MEYRRSQFTETLFRDVDNREQCCLSGERYLIDTPLVAAYDTSRRGTLGGYTKKSLLMRQANEILSRG